MLPWLVVVIINVKLVPGNPWYHWYQTVNLVLASATMLFTSPLLDSFAVFHVAIAVVDRRCSDVRMLGWESKMDPSLTRLYAYYGRGSGLV